MKQPKEEIINLLSPAQNKPQAFMAESPSLRAEAKLMVDGSRIGEEMYY